MAPSFFKFINFEFSNGLNILQGFCICGLFEIWKSISSFFVYLSATIWEFYTRRFFYRFGHQFSIVFQTYSWHSNPISKRSDWSWISSLSANLPIVSLFCELCNSSRRWRIATAGRSVYAFADRMRRIFVYLFLLCLTRRCFFLGCQSLAGDVFDTDSFQPSSLNEVSWPWDFWMLPTCKNEFSKANASVATSQLTWPTDCAISDSSWQTKLHSIYLSFVFDLFWPYMLEIVQLFRLVSSWHFGPWLYTWYTQGRPFYCNFREICWG